MGWASRILIKVVAFAAFVVGSQTIDVQAPVVTLKNGTYAGIHNSQYNQDFFLGIPFSQPPTGQLRLALPQSLNESWSGVRNATSYGPGCIGFSAAEIDRPISEDCLSINIVRPSGLENEKLPVLLWIFGGGFIQGLNADPRYNLSFIVQNSVNMGKPIVAASINYRLNGYGFSSSSELADAGLLNLGLKDQRLAMHWLQENVGAFGGDPTQVTIWGQSAGAMSIGMHLIAYGGRDESLFRAAICDSGAPAMPAPASAAVRQKAFDTIVNGTGCSSAQDKLNCLRNVSSDVFEKAVNASGASYSPVVDGNFIPTYPSDLVKQGKFVKVPLLIGANHDEGTNFAGNPPSSPYSNDTVFENTVASRINNASLVSYAVDKLTALYPNIPAIGIPITFHGVPNATFGAQYKRASAFIGDVMIHRGRRLSAQGWSAYGVPIYSYEFDAWPIAGQPDNSGTTHFTEIQLVFDNEAGNGYVEPWWPRGSEFAGVGQALIPLARLMSRMWVSFAHDLNPNNHGISDFNGTAIPTWPVYSANSNLTQASDDAAQGYGVNFRFHQALPGLAEAQQDIYRAEAIDFLIENSASLLLF